MFLCGPFFKVFIEFVTILLLFYDLVFLAPEACRILAPRPGVEPASSALEGKSLNHWRAREVPKLVNFYVAILILKMEEKKGIFSTNFALLLQEKAKTQLKHKNRFVQCMEMVLWLTEHIKRYFRSFMLEISRWTMLYCLVDQMKLTVIKSRC